MKLKEVLDKTTAFFKEKKFDSPRLDAELLLAHGLGIERIQLYLKFDQTLQEDELQKCRELIRRRNLGEPVAYIVGYKDFYGLRFLVNDAVLIPRPETEHVVEAAVAWAKDKNKEYKILDLGCGSGCIGQTLLRYLPNAKLIAVDISEKALQVAKQNAELFKLLDRIEFIQGDADTVLSEVKTSIDILVANPPYIDRQDIHVEENVKKFEPDLALFSPEKGLHSLKLWSDLYKDQLAMESTMIMEMGYDQGPAMKAHFESLGIFQEVRVIKDLSGHDRIIYGVKHG